MACPPVSVFSFLLWGFGPDHIIKHCQSHGVPIWTYVRAYPVFCYCGWWEDHMIKHCKPQGIPTDFFPCLPIARVLCGGSRIRVWGISQSRETRMDCPKIWSNLVTRKKEKGWCIVQNLSVQYFNYMWNMSIQLLSDQKFLIVYFSCSSIIQVITVCSSSI